METNQPMAGGATFSAPSATALLSAKQRQLITRLYKGYLVLLEEMYRDHDIALAKLCAHLPEDYRGHVELADYLPDERIEANRRKVLAAGNDCIRELDEIVKGLRLDREDGT